MFACRRYVASDIATSTGASTAVSVGAVIDAGSGAVCSSRCARGSSRQFSQQ